MSIIRKKPGVIILPVLAVFIIFSVLLFLVVSQKRSNNALLLEYRASGIINAMLDFYVQGDIPDPGLIDEDIIGLGIYDLRGGSVYRYGSAPDRINLDTLNGNNIKINNNRSIEIIRSIAAPEGQPPGGNMMRMPPGMMNYLRGQGGPRRGPSDMNMMERKYRTAVYLEYRNAAYLSERRLVVLTVLLFTAVFVSLSFVIYKLYSRNRSLEARIEHDKQTVQLGEAARTLAHEIRNPLGVLKVQRDLLKKKLPGGYESNLNAIDRELKRLTLLVERVGDFLRNPEGRQKSIELAAFLSQLYSDRDDVLFGFDELAGFTICFDEARLRTVTDNIINNAVDSGGTARLKLSRRSGFVVLGIADDGPGIPDEIMDRIFDPFFTTKEHGSGLGLSIVKRMMDAGGGRIDIMSTGPGTLIELCFKKQIGDDCENTSG